ncbi:hypothetical protein ABPG74_010922 [Tetrahymena malaccensis]
MSFSKIKQFYENCPKCNRIKSIFWSKCPHCHDDSSRFLNVFKIASSNPALNDYVFNKIAKYTKGQFKNNQGDRKHVQNLSIQDNDQNQIDNYVERTKKNLAQNQFSVVNQNSQYNFKFNDSFFKYSIMIIVLTLTLCLIIHDMSGLRQKELQIIVNEIDQCGMNYDSHDCEKVITNSKITKEWKQTCIQWKICKDRDPYSEVQILKIMAIYFAGIMSLSFDQMNGKAVGIVLFIYFFGVILKHFLSCICPRRK